MYKRTETRPIYVGGIQIGGQNKCVIQSMCNTKTKDVEKTVEQILELEKVGCEIIRVACLDIEDAKAIKQIKEKMQRLEEYTNTYNQAQNMQVLQPHYIFIDGEGTYKLPELNKVIDILNNRMQNLKTNDFSVEPKPFVVFGCADV